MTDEPDLVARITTLDLETKVRLLTGASTFTLHGEERIGLEPMAFSDGPTGVRGLEFVGGEQVALLPNATLIASSWDEELAHEVGQLLAEEAERQHIHVVLGPTINLHRTPLGGRLFEAYSEDPLLTGRLAASYVKGLQRNGIGACLKHLVANESETERHTVNSVVDEATLREVYLLPFEIAVEEANPWSIMAAYNDVNGVPATEQVHVINDVVKGEWGYDGLVMSDWYATKSAAPAANAGLDLVMPGPHGPWGSALVAAVKGGEVPEAVIDEHLLRVLRLADRVGALGGPRSWPDSRPSPTDAARRRQLTRIAASGMTVLRNDGILPLRPGLRVALVGRHAVQTIDMGGGSAQVNPPHQVSVAEGLTALLDGAVRVVDGVEVRTRPAAADPAAVTSPASGAPGIHVVAWSADGVVLADHDVARTAVSFGHESALPEPAARVALRATVGGTGPREVGVIGAGRWSVTVAGERHDVDLTLSSGDVAEALFTPPHWTTVVDTDGDVELEAEVLVPEAALARFAVAARPAPRPVRDVVEDAVAAAAEADVAVVVVGLTEEQETEAADKTTLRLPGRQDDLVSAVAAAARHTVVVVNAATPVLMPWFDDVDAVLLAGIPGQEGGHAVASALLGTIEPAGRLVTSFPAADGATPAWDVVPVGGQLHYAEGPFVGYRGHYAGRAPRPALWFGHGLGYGSWDYSDVTVSSGSDEPVTLTATVTNTSSRASREIVQVYLEPADRSRPVRLVGWRGVDVEPGASARVEVRCDERMWRRWDSDSGRWARLEGPAALLVARGLGDIRARVDLPESR